MKDDRLPKLLFYGVLKHRKIPKHERKKDNEDDAKNNLRGLCGWSLKLGVDDAKSTSLRKSDQWRL